MHMAGMSVKLSSVCFYQACFHVVCIFFFFQAEDGIRDGTVTGVQTCALPISSVTIEHPITGTLELIGAAGPDGAEPDLLFCDNETNTTRLYGTHPVSPYPKRSEEHTSELQSQFHLVCRLLLEKKKSHDDDGKE